ncbi:hypothetical protein [Arthrobacter sp. H14-L1]|uniref:hypothetical protein n=1 Tax=Arthrobacter sp. H14-L1 TaxID=2996697 RepID=UPI00226E4213|nr:hypothetical protein [Arthrobacter sp. H14-L1]
MVRMKPSPRNKTALILVMAACVFTFVGQALIIRTPGAHVPSWVLLISTVLLFAAAAVIYVRQGKGPGTPSSRS